MTRTLACACGGTIAAAPAAPGPAVIAHNRSPRHVAWRELGTARADLDAYRRAVELVRPWMEGTSLTVAEAIERMRAAGIDPSPIVAALGVGPEASA